MSNEYKGWLEELKLAPVGSKDHNRWLALEYPFLVPARYWDGYEISKDYDYKYTLLDDLPEGWRIAFGEQMCAEIKEALLKADDHEDFDGNKIPAIDNYSILQIKEKFGGLRWYDIGSTNEVDDIINKYEALSFFTCINCGEPATQVSQNWISPYCDECAKEEQARLKYEKFVPIDKYYK